MPVRKKTAREMLGGRSAVAFGSSSEAALIKKYHERKGGKAKATK